MKIGDVTITLWIATAACGVGVTAWNLRDAWLDLRALDTLKLKNGRRLIAHVALANEAALLIACLLLFVAGILVAAIQYNPNPPPASLYVRSAIMLTILILVLNSVVSRWRRHTLEDILITEAEASARDKGGTK